MSHLSGRYCQAGSIADLGGVTHSYNAIQAYLKENGTLDVFFTTFGSKEDEPMWKKPEDRVRGWWPPTTCHVERDW